MPSNPTFAERIQQARRSRVPALSQRALGVRLGDRMGTGPVGGDVISRWERGENAPGRAHRAALVAEFPELGEAATMAAGHAIGSAAASGAASPPRDACADILTRLQGAVKDLAILLGEAEDDPPGEGTRRLPREG